MPEANDPSLPSIPYPLRSALQLDAFNRMAVGSQLYPEWPLAATSRVPRDLRIRVAAALQSLTPSHPAVRSQAPAPREKPTMHFSKPPLSNPPGRRSALAVHNLPAAPAGGVGGVRDLGSAALVLVGHAPEHGPWRLPARHRRVPQRFGPQQRHLLSGRLLQETRRRDCWPMR